MSLKRTPSTEEPSAASILEEEDPTEGELSEEEKIGGEESRVGKKAAVPAKEQDSGASVTFLFYLRPRTLINDSGSELDSPTTDQHIRPYASKPMEDTSKIKKGRYTVPLSTSETSNVGGPDPQLGL